MGEWDGALFATTLELFVAKRVDELFGGAGDEEGRRRELLDVARTALRENITDAVRDGLDKSFNEIDRIITESIASGGPVQPRKRRRKGTGRPSRLPTEEVERSAIKIIRDIGAGPGDLQKVAMVYYSAGDYKKAAPS